MTPESDNDDHEVLNKRQARQGRSSFAMRVLIISLGLIVIAFALAYIFGETTEEPTPTTAPQEDVIGTDPPSDAPEDITETEPPPNVPPDDATELEPGE